MPWYIRWRNVFRSEHLSRELEDELQHHLLEKVDALVARGLPVEEAWRAARIQIGNYATQKERTREMNIATWLDTVRGDVIYAFRQLRSNPGFTGIAVLSLALGIGANTAIFQLVDAIRLKTLPVKDPQELVAIDFASGAVRYGGWSSRSAVLTYPQWQELRNQQRAFAGVLAWSADRFNLAAGGEPHLVEGLHVSGEFFRQLGVTAILGRTFTGTDDGGTCNPGAVVSYGFWKRDLGGDTSVLGRTVRLNGHSFPIIGVTGASFFGVEVGSRFDVAVPLCADAVLQNVNRLPVRDAYWLSAMGRLRPGESVRTANAYLHVLSPAIMRATAPASYRPDAMKGYLANRLIAKPAGTGVSELREQIGRPLWILLATTALVLLIACTNLANLLLARATAREPEIALRMAIGASRGRLIRQLLVESLLLAAGGASLGALLAVNLSAGLVKFVSTSNSPLFVDLTTDWRMVGFTAGVALLTCLFFGLLPAVRATYLSPVTAMRAGGRNVTANRQRFGLRRALIVTQVALSMVLMFGASLFLRSLHKLLAVSTGFDSRGIVAIHVGFPANSYPPDRVLIATRVLIARLHDVDGVVSLAQVGFEPVSGSMWNNTVAPDQETAAANGKLTYFNMAGPGYFRTMGTTLLTGREFNDRDTVSSPRVAIVNEEFAKRFFAGANPVGHIFHRAADAGQPEPVFQIVGLVRNTKYSELREDFKPIAFLAAAQDPGHEAAFVLRSSGAAEPLIKRVHHVLGEFDPSLEVAVRSLPAELDESLLRERLMATLSGGFGILAAILAAIGLYGVVSYMVARRQNEIGVRIALGAARARVVRMVIGEATALVGMGLAAGTVIALCAGRAAGTLLFGIPAYDFESLIAATLMLTTIALVASYVPARKASRLEPMIALRNE